MLSLIFVLTDFAAGLAGGFIGGFVQSFARAALHAAVSDWFSVLCILACAIIGGVLLGRWRRGPLLLDAVIGSVAYLALNTIVLIRFTPVATVLVGGGLVVLGSFVAWFLASRRRRAGVRPEGNTVERPPLLGWQKLVFGIGGLALMLSVLSTLYAQYTGSGTTVIMAGCGEDRVMDVLKSIVQQKTGATLTQVDDVTTVSTNSEKAVCTAMLGLSNGEAGRMGYDITVVDGHYQVMMTGLAKTP